MDIPALFDRLRQHDRLALSRLLTHAARGEYLNLLRSLLPTCRESKPVSRVVAITGSAGVGKSTLIGKLIEVIRAHERSVAVLACDPQSALTGGALLGDRFRMPSRPQDAGVFIRSVATTSGREAVAEHLEVMIELLNAFGFNLVLVETVGAGQGDTAVRRLADVVILLLQPEAGDDIQWEKAGVLEVADIVVIHKGDLPGAERVEAQVKSLLNLPGCRDLPVLRVSAARGEGIENLYQLLTQASVGRAGIHRDEHHLLRLTQQRLAERFQLQVQHLRPVLEQWQRQQLNDHEAAEAILRLLVPSA